MRERERDHSASNWVAYGLMQGVEHNMYKRTKTYRCACRVVVQPWKFETDVFATELQRLQALLIVPAIPYSITT